jgi:peptide/nickel transport system ATP-binding protein
MPEPLLDLNDLRIERWSHGRWLPVVDGIEMQLTAGQMFGLVGESGSGKSTLLQALAGLLPTATTRISGRARFGSIDLTRLDEAGWRRLRGRDLCWLPQNPMNALNPVARVDSQLTALLAARAGLKRNPARDRLRAALHQLDLPDDPALLRRYPGELSGGQRQRLLMALALACKPRLLLADEPTSALDTSSRGTLLARLHQACQDRGIDILTVSHDLALVAGHCERLAVMYAGQLVESGPVGEVFASPAHPYTAALLAAHPAIAAQSASMAGPRPIPGQPPAADSWPEGCRFANRCQACQTRCVDSAPALHHDRRLRSWRCHFPLTGHDCND